MNAAHHAPAPLASLEISLRIGQRVRHNDFHGKRVTGVVRGLSVDSEDVLHADIALDVAIVIPPIDTDEHELRIYRQHVPAYELAPFDEREELIGELLDAGRDMVAAWLAMSATCDEPQLLDLEGFKKLRAVIAKAGSMS